MSQSSKKATGAGGGQGKPTDVRVTGVELYLLPVTTRVPLKFGTETMTSVTCARVQVFVAGRDGRTAAGWGETPLSVQWAWPANFSYAERHEAMIAFCRRLAQAWAAFNAWGHPIEIGSAFQHDVLGQLVEEFNRDRPEGTHLPHLAGLICCSPFDIAIHDAYGQLHERPVYATYNSQFMKSDLAAFLESDNPDVDFRGHYPSDYLSQSSKRTLPVWHLVGGLDPLEPGDLTGREPDDSYPVLLGDWIDRDGLTCLKVKLRGDDAAWDYDRLMRVGRLGLARGVKHLSADFNCTVREPEYVNEILDRLAHEEPAVYGAILYVEQPFPYDLERHQIDVRDVSARKPLFMDESAHDWRLVRLGRSLGWTGVALKTCKTQTGAILSLCWARAHSMSLMVQDLTNPMLAQIPHVLLAAHADTIMGVESNAMQFYPEASAAEARIHPGLYARRHGVLDLSTIAGPGFGYRVEEIGRKLPDLVIATGETRQMCDFDPCDDTS
ncbi:MAG TPA: enolase C-terminal domain-like protein [Lacipirellulaceae bacterium]|nr:enolase C-terminal domain-like protein [Lacipirellulaceae bacterium]